MIQEQVLSTSQMQELEELGIDTSNASMFWYAYDFSYSEKEIEPRDYRLYTKRLHKLLGNLDIQAFTLQDILEILPSYKITYDKYTNDSDKYEIRVDIPEGQHYITHIAQSSKSLLESAFNMLKWCKQNNYI